jgi:hypothetical protein
LTGTFSISGAAGVFQDTGVSVTLPSAGTYKLTANARCSLTGNVGTAWFIVIKLYNSTDAADVTNSERMAVRDVTGNNVQLTAPIDIIITVAASKVIKLYAARDGLGSPSWTTSNITSDSSGRVNLSYEKIG